MVIAVVECAEVPARDHSFLDKLHTCTVENTMDSCSTIFLNQISTSTSFLYACYYHHYRARSDSWGGWQIFGRLFNVIQQTSSNSKCQPVAWSLLRGCWISDTSNTSFCNTNTNTARRRRSIPIPTDGKGQYLIPIPIPLGGKYQYQYQYLQMAEVNIQYQYQYCQKAGAPSHMLGSNCIDYEKYL